MIDDYTRECLALKVRRHFKVQDVVEVLAELFLKRGLPCHVRSDNGSEFKAKVVRRWLEKFEIKNLFIEPGSTWEKGYNESFDFTNRFLAVVHKLKSLAKKHS